MALTATATPEVVMDIIGSLKLENPAFFISSFVRNNLEYMIRPKSENEFRNIITLIKKNYSKDSGIIYCLSRFVFKTLFKATSLETTVRKSAIN